VVVVEKVVFRVEWEDRCMSCPRYRREVIGEDDVRRNLRLAGLP